MPISIPSKNIYHKKNEKIKDNIISSVSILGSNATIGISDEQVYNNSFPITEEEKNSFEFTENYVSEKYAKYGNMQPFGEELAWGYIFSGYVLHKQVEIKIKIPKEQFNLKIIDLNKVLNGEGISYSVYGNVYSSIATANVNIEIKLDSLFQAEFKKADFDFSSVKENENERELIAENVLFNDYGGQTTETLSAIGPVQNSSHTLKIVSPIFKNPTDFSNINIFFNKDTNEYEFTLNIMCDVAKATFKKKEKLKDVAFVNNTFTMESQVDDFEVYIGNRIDISINGHVYTVNLKSDNKTYGSGNKPFELDTGGFLQTTSYYEKRENVITKKIANSILNSYSLGKETATIRCSINNYYDYDSGDKIISVDNSTGKMSFEIYDEVIPMIYGADGKDRPMSLYQDGSPKVFNVLGSKIYYDGAVWQELSLQEKTKSD